MVMQMTIQQIQYVSEIANSNSMNKAAQSLFISQPTLSHSIKELETEIGVVLFERSRKGVRLTSDGIEFLRVAKDLLGQMEHIRQRYLIKSGRSIARFQVSCQHYSFVVDAFIQFLKLYGDRKYVFCVKETKTLSTIDDVYSQKSAMGVLFLNSRNENFVLQVLNKRGIDFHFIGSVRPHVFLRKSHPLAGKESIEMRELDPYPAIIYAQEGDEQLTEESFIINERDKMIITHDRCTMLNIIENTDSYNIGTGYVIPGINSNNIVSISLSDTDDEMRIGWIHLSGRRPSEDSVRFAGLLEESMSRYHPEKNRF